MYRFSILDHFILSGTLFDECVSSASVLHDVDNLSDHDPIFLCLNIDLKYFCPYVIVFFLHVFLGSRHPKMMLIIIELLCCVV